MAHKAIKQMQGGRKRKTDGGVRALIRLVAGCVPTPRAIEGMNEQRRKGIEGNVTRRVRKLQENIRHMCAVRERRTRVQRAEEARTRRAVIVEAGKKETKKRRKEERTAKDESQKRKRGEEMETTLRWERGTEREDGEERQGRNERQQKRAREMEERAQRDTWKQESESESNEEEERG